MPGSTTNYNTKTNLYSKPNLFSKPTENFFSLAFIHLKKKNN